VTINRNNKELFYNRSLERSLQILNALGNERKPLTLAQLSEALGLSKATVLRLCSTLVKYGFLRQGPEPRYYSLGLRLFELGSIVLSSFSLRNVASPCLTQLQMKLNKTVFLGIIAEDELLYIDKREDGEMGISFPSNIGRRRPPYWGMLGPVLMAYLPEDEVDRLLEKHPFERTAKKSYADKEVFKEQLRVIRTQGYFVEDETAFESIGGIAAPVRDFKGKVVAAVGVGFIFLSADSKDIKKMIKEVTTAATAISRELGYTAEKQEP
jgi:IclR family transcriptional regulator, KDG regulon repressor